MNVSPLSSVTSAYSMPDAGKAPAAASSPTTTASHPSDTVTLSAGAQKAAASGDVDHDGDSH